MFRLPKKTSSPGSHNQCLAKIARSASELRQTSCRRCQCYDGIEWPMWWVCCALCKRIRLHSAQHTHHTGHSMPPWHWQRLSQLWSTSCNFS